MTAIPALPTALRAPALGLCLAVHALLLAACAPTGPGGRTGPATGTAPATTASDPAGTTEDKTNCVHGCQKWGEACNVDPRGVYKCQRRCERFGEICE
jgi:hypothetical protein